MDIIQESKFWLVQTVDLARDALHIYVGLIVFFAAAALLRTSLKDWRPLAAVLIVALIGEAWDLFDMHSGKMQPDLGESWKDLWNTMFWPTAITLLARCTRLFSR